MLYVVCNAVGFFGPHAAWQIGLAETLVATAILAGATWWLLRLRKWPERFAQTFTALLLTGAVFTVLAIGPMTQLLPYIAEGRNPPLPLLLGPVAIIVWRVAVMAHIYRHALEIGIGRGVGLVVALDLVRWAVLTLLAMSGLFHGLLG